MVDLPCACATGNHNFSRAKAKKLNFVCEVDGTAITCTVPESSPVKTARGALPEADGGQEEPAALPEGLKDDLVAEESSTGVEPSPPEKTGAKPKEPPAE